MASFATCEGGFKSWCGNDVVLAPFGVGPDAVSGLGPWIRTTRQDSRVPVSTEVWPRDKSAFAAHPRQSRFLAKCAAKAMSDGRVKRAVLADASKSRESAREWSEFLTKAAASGLVKAAAPLGGYGQMSTKPIPKVTATTTPPPTASPSARPPAPAPAPTMSVGQRVHGAAFNIPRSIFGGLAMPTAAVMGAFNDTPNSPHRWEMLHGAWKDFKSPYEAASGVPDKSGPAMTTMFDQHADAMESRSQDMTLNDWARRDANFDAHAYRWAPTLAPAAAAGAVGAYAGGTRLGAAALSKLGPWASKLPFAKGVAENAKFMGYSTAVGGTLSGGAAASTMPVGEAEAKLISQNRGMSESTEPTAFGRLQDATNRTRAIAGKPPVVASPAEIAAVRHNNDMVDAQTRLGYRFETPASDQQERQGVVQGVKPPGTPTPVDAATGTGVGVNELPQHADQQLITTQTQSVAGPQTPATPQEAAAKIPQLHFGMETALQDAMKADNPQQAHAVISKLLPEQVDAFAAANGKDPAQFRARMGEILQDGQVKPAELQEMFAKAPAAKDLAAKSSPPGQPGTFEGFVNQFNALGPGQKVAIGLGLPLAVISLMSALFGGGGFMSVLTTVLGLGAAAAGGGMFGGEGPLKNTGQQLRVHGTGDYLSSFFRGQGSGGQGQSGAQPGWGEGAVNSALDFATNHFGPGANASEYDKRMWQLSKAKQFGFGDRAMQTAMEKTRMPRPAVEAMLSQWESQQPK